jgi:hypothetical protein
MVSCAFQKGISLRHGMRLRYALRTVRPCKSSARTSLRFAVGPPRPVNAVHAKSGANKECRILAETRIADAVSYVASLRLRNQREAALPERGS